MKTKITFLLIFTLLAFVSKSQVVLYEDFTAPFSPVANGWSVQNLSFPTGTNATGWFQGDPLKFDALNGLPTDYFAADMNSTSSAGATNTISAWLLTPTLNLANGCMVQFAVNGSILPNVKPDRLQLYYSTDGAGVNVGASVSTPTNSAGSFTNIVTDINPSLFPYGLPTEWAVFTVTLTGIATPTVGRLGFRYYVPNGGAAGPNGNYIGIDEFRYYNPCALPFVSGSWLSNQLCMNNPLILGISSNPDPSITSYTWSNGANTTTTSVVPTHTNINSYCLMGESTPGCISMCSINAYVISSPTVTVTRNPNGVVCAGSTFTLTAAGAVSYTYQLSANSSATFNPLALTVPPVTTSTTTQFTLTGRGSNNCRHTQVFALPIYPNPTVTVVSSSNAVCLNKTFTLTVSGAATYTWSGSAVSTGSAVNYTSTATAGMRNFTVNATSQDGCRSIAVVKTVTVSACTHLDDTQENVSSISVYPNPFSNELKIKDFSGAVAVYNNLGQKVIHATLGTSDVIETSQLPAGLYILRIFDDFGNSKDFKLVKN